MRHPGCLCRVYWDSGTAVMLTSAMIMSCGALAVALIDDRVPVFEIVVRHRFSSFPFMLSAALVLRVAKFQLSMRYDQIRVAGKGELQRIDT